MTGALLLMLLIPMFCVLCATFPNFMGTLVPLLVFGAVVYVYTCRR